MPYAYIQSKTDIVQQAFYIAIAVTTNSERKLITPSQFYDDVNDIFELYNTNTNFITYLVDGYQHCFTNMDIYYTADPLSQRDDGKNSNMSMMYQWTNLLPLVPDCNISTVCVGKTEATAFSSLQTGEGKNDYCDVRIYDKTYESEIR